MSFESTFKDAAAGRGDSLQHYHYAPSWPVTGHKTDALSLHVLLVWWLAAGHTSSRHPEPPEPHESRLRPRGLLSLGLGPGNCSVDRCGSLQKAFVSASFVLSAWGISESSRDQTETLQP